MVEKVKNQRVIPRSVLAGCAVASLLLLAAGCANGQGEGRDGDVSADILERQKLPDWLELSDIETMETRGNVGEKPSWYTDVELTPDQIDELKGMNLKAAFLNWDSSAYNQSILAGTEDSLKALGIDMVAVTNYKFDAATLQQDVRNVMALNPDIIFYSGVDPTSDKAALQPAVDAGVAIVSFANAPGDWTTGSPSNFVTLVSYPTHEMGAVVANEVVKRFDGGKLGMIFYDANYKLVNEREKGFEDAISASDIEIVTRQPMVDPSKTQGIASAMVARDADLDVIFAPWDGPAEGVVAGLNGANKEVPVATIDLGFSGATSIACDGLVFVESSQMVYEWGRTAAISAGLHVLGEEVPPFLVTPVFAVTKENIEEAWDLAYEGGIPLPKEAEACLTEG